MIKCELYKRFNLVKKLCFFKCITSFEQNNVKDV